MDVLKFTIGILLVAVSTERAVAQDFEQISEQSIQQVDSPELSLTSVAEHDSVITDEHADESQPTLSGSVLVSDLTKSEPEESDSATAPASNWRSDCTEGCRSSCCDCPCPRVYGQVEALFLQREPRLRRQAIVVDPNSDTTFMSTSDLNFDYDPGLRTTIGVRLWGGRAMEFSYFGLSDGTADAVAASDDPAAFLEFPDNLFGNVFVDPDLVRARYSSQLHSFELNFPCCCGCCENCRNGCQGNCRNQHSWDQTHCHSVEWFTGFRYINLDEELNVSAQRIVGGGLEEGSYDLRTSNHLYGVQLGMRERHTRGRFGWEAGGKAGIFGNDAHQSQSVTDFPDFPLRPTVASSGGQVAFIGDTNLTALYRLTKVWNLRAGYNAIWIEGLALAPDQLDFDFASANGGSQLHTGGGMFLHGVNLGVEARW